MVNVRRVLVEVEALKPLFEDVQVGKVVIGGARRIVVLIRGFPLPEGFVRIRRDGRIVTAPSTKVLLVLPSNYGFSSAPPEIFLDRGLRFVYGGRVFPIPHYFEAGQSPYPSLLRRGWGWLCLRFETWNPQKDTLWTALKTVQAYLSALRENPFNEEVR